jgi:putative iron-dependent peroxidase
MLENMFVGRPPGTYDRLLDISRPVTGSLFFVPAASFLDNITTGAVVTAESGDPVSTDPVALPTSTAARDTSLKIGSLKRSER